MPITPAGTFSVLRIELQTANDLRFAGRSYETRTSQLVAQTTSFACLFTDRHLVVQFDAPRSTLYAMRGYLCLTTEDRLEAT